MVFTPPRVDDDIGPAAHPDPQSAKLALERLDEALALFLSGEANGRAGADIALRTARIFLMSALGLDHRDPRLTPINAVIAGLDRLDDGATPTLFKPSNRPTGGRPPAEQGEVMAKVTSVYTARELTKHFPGVSDPRKAARTLVAETLNRWGFVPARTTRITERTIRDWDEAASAGGISEIALGLADFQTQPPPNLPDLQPAKARDWLVKRLTFTLDTAQSTGILNRKPR